MTLIQMNYYFKNADLFKGMPFYERPLMKVKVETALINKNLYLISNFGHFDKYNSFHPSDEFSSYEVLNHLVAN